MNNNKIAAAMAQIKNAGAAKRLIVVLKDYSTLLENILMCLKENGYINNFEKFVHNNKTTLIVKLAYYQPYAGEYMKNYNKDVNINEFFEANKEKMFDMNKKIISPRVPNHYVHVIKSLTNKSTGGQVLFAPYSELYKYRDKSNTFGILILTTSKGVLSHVDAINQKVGGQILLGVY